MVDFANKPIATPNFHFISPLDTVRLAAKSKRQFLAKNHHQILHFFVADFLGKKWFKSQTSALTAILKAIPWYLFGIFFSCYFRWTCFIKLARSCSKGILGNWVTPWTPPIPISLCVGPPSPTSEILHLLLCLQVKTHPNCFGRSGNPSTERPERWLLSWNVMPALKHVAWENSRHLAMLPLLSLPNDV